jgi:hypothetical protein
MKRLFIILASLAALSASATQPISISAKLDSVEVLQGCLRTVDVEVLQPAGVNARWLIDREGIVEVAPGVEVHTRGDIDTTKIDNNRLQLRRQLLIQPWDSGEVVIPGLALVAGADTFRSNDMALKVYTADVDTMTTVHDMVGAIAPSRHFWDFLPNWIADYWWAYLLVILALAAAGVAYWLHKKGGLRAAISSPAKPVPPYERAIAELETLRTRQLCERGQEREFYTELTEILREYLEGRFGINAMEMTTTQIKTAVRSNSTTAASGTLMNDVLEMADFVKFAKMRPLPEDNVRSYAQALNFVENTKPVEEPQQEAAADKKEGGKK